MIIYLDMDGVLADFVSGSIRAHERAGFSHDDVVTFDYPTEQWGISEEAFWRRCCSREFWAGLDPYPWARELVMTCQRYGPVYFLTSPTKTDHHECLAGKSQWLQRVIGGDAHLRMIPTRFKRLLANRNAVLIDDSTQNLEEFLFRGGWTLGFKQPWNDCVWTPGTIAEGLFSTQEMMELA